MEVTRTFDILEWSMTNHPKEDALAGKKNKQWVKYSTEEYVNTATNISYGLLSLGLQKGDRIATISSGRPEWNFIDMGMSQAGFVHVPIYPTISEEDYEYILQHAEPKLVFIADKNLFTKLSPIIQKTKTVQGTYTFNDVEGTKSWTEVLELGKENASKYENELQEIKKSIAPQDLLTIIYTSGTTGFPVILLQTSLPHHMFILLGKSQNALVFCQLVIYMNGCLTIISSIKV
jgi:long-chain acyl-CoA synthetase